jgi:hypothetical protein
VVRPLFSRIVYVKWHKKLLRLNAFDVSLSFLRHVMVAK